MDVVTIKIGPGEQKFSVHKSLLTEASAFFKASLDGNFREAAQNEVNMPEENVHVFEVFLHWLYFGFPPEDTQTEKAIAHTAEIERIVDLYVLGDKIGCQELKRDMVKSLYHLVESDGFSFPHAAIEHIYDAPIVIAPLRRVTAAFLVWIVGPSKLADHEKLDLLFKCQPELTHDVLKEVCMRFSDSGALDPRRRGWKHLLGNE